MRNVYVFLDSFSNVFHWIGPFAQAIFVAQLDAIFVAP